jgi:hypothetical protein
VEVGGNGRGAPCNSHEAAGGWNGGYAGLVGGCNQYGTLAWPGFSGGGATDIRTATLGSGIPLTGVRATDPRLLVAGGGGSMDLTFGGGNAGVPSSDVFNGNGADGQTKNSYCNGVTPDQCHFGGYGGTQTAGGAGGVYGGGAGGPGYGGGGATGPSVNQGGWAAAVAAAARGRQPALAAAAVAPAWCRPAAPCSRRPTTRRMRRSSTPCRRTSPAQRRRSPRRPTAPPME